MRKPALSLVCFLSASLSYAICPDLKGTYTCVNDQENFEIEFLPPLQKSKKLDQFQVIDPKLSNQTYEVQISQKLTIEKKTMNGSEFTSEEYKDRANRAFCRERKTDAHDLNGYEGTLTLEFKQIPVSYVQERGDPFFMRIQRFPNEGKPGFHTVTHFCAPKTEKTAQKVIIPYESKAMCSPDNQNGPFAHLPVPTDWARPKNQKRAHPQESSEEDLATNSTSETQTSEAQTQAEKAQVKETQETTSTGRKKQRVESAPATQTKQSSRCSVQ